MKFKRLLVVVLAVLMPGAALVFGTGSMGCSSGSGSSDAGGISGEVSNYVLPSEISAIPVSSGAQSSISTSPFKSAIKSLSKAATDPDTDYSKAVTRTYVEEHTLEQFDILETVMKAIDQTKYVNEIGKGPYIAKVAWEEESNKGSVQMDAKAVQTWVCQVDLVDADEGVVTDKSLASALRLMAWIEEDGEEGPEIVRAQILITTPPTINADGSYADYGEWTMNVQFGDGENDYFVAHSSNSGDDNIIMIKDRFEENFPNGDFLSEIEDRTVEMRAVMYRSAGRGYGKVSYPDFSAIFSPESEDEGESEEGDFASSLIKALTSIPILEASYTYNVSHLAVRGSDGIIAYRDRNSVVPMTHRYGVFRADTGEDIVRLKSFGFPVRVQTADGYRHGYYGAWQGRHQIWMNDNAATPEGAIAQREDLPPDEVEEYVVGPTFNGTLAKRSYISASLDDIKGIPMEIWIDEDYQLVYTNGGWYECFMIDWENSGECVEGQLAESPLNLESLVVGGKDTRKHVDINGFDEVEMEDKRFVYLSAPFNDFFEDAGEGEPNLDVRIDTDNVPRLWIYIGGSIYVEYKGEEQGWVEKELVAFDTRKWMPYFNDSGDKAFVLPEERELYINIEGANYVVRRSGTDYTVKLELQTVANPVNAATFVPTETVFRSGWDDSESGSTYEFITDTSSPKFLMLVYKTIGDDDKDANGDAEVNVGDVVAQNMWGLKSNINGAQVDFNWEYSEDGGWGSVTYLKNSDGTYKLLDDPVMFDSITVVNGAGVQKTLSLKFDGWLHGLPEFYEELEKNNWAITSDISDKIINIPAGTGLVDVITGTAYLIKPLDQGFFLESTADPGGLDITLADAVDLSVVPDFVAPEGMEEIPDASLFYSEGVCVDSSHCGE